MLGFHKLCVTLVVSLLTLSAHAEARSIRLASTTSTENSGLLAYLLPLFEAKTKIKVRVIAVGTGQALRIARNGDADVLLVHHKPSEEAFVRAGFGVKRYRLMYNDFIVVGPKNDPARIRGLSNVQTALNRITKTSARFLSRGDDSGTHKRELDLWRLTRKIPNGRIDPWYRETGSGMGATLNTAAAMDAYTLTDRATWIGFKNKRDLALLVQGDKRLFNQYGIIRVNPRIHPHIKARLAKTFVRWLLSPEGQGAIARYRLNGVQLFFPNAK